MLRFTTARSIRIAPQRARIDGGDGGIPIRPSSRRQRAHANCNGYNVAPWVRRSTPRRAPDAQVFGTASRRPDGTRARFVVREVQWVVLCCSKYQAAAPPRGGEWARDDVASSGPPMDVTRDGRGRGGAGRLFRRALPSCQLLRVLSPPRRLSTLPCRFPRPAPPVSRRHARTQCHIVIAGCALHSNRYTMGAD